MTGRDYFFDRLHRDWENHWQGFDMDVALEFPLLNAVSTQDDIVVMAEIPGVDPKALDISIVGDTLTLRGERRGQVSDNDNCIRRERMAGSFSRTLELPFRVDAAKVNARCEHGILHLTLPRAEKDKPRKISVHVQ